MKVDEVIKTYPNGVYEAKVSVKDPSSSKYFEKTNNGGISTMFPKTWTSDRIKVEVSQSFNNKVVNGNKWYGITPSGVKVEGFISPHTTAYPSPNQ